MACKIMSIKKSMQSGGWTLLEMMIAVTIFTIASAAVGSAYLFGLRSFQALSNYSILDQQNRNAMDKLTREVRQARWVEAKTDDTLILKDGNYDSITYKFNGDSQQLVRTAKGNTTVMLENCSLIKFVMATRVPNTNVNDANFYTDYYETSDMNEAKVINLSWKTRRELPNGVGQSENIQTARIVIRKQKLFQ
jgi:prepilin-type N-terminal cleavage/methylation domain-containing protein